MFKSQVDDQAENNNDDEVVFTSDDNDISQNIELQPDQSLIFRVWIEFLYKIAFIFQTLFEILSLVIKPTYRLIEMIFKTIYSIPSYFYTEFFENKCVLKDSNGFEKSSTYDLLKEGHENKHENEFSSEFKDLVFKMLAYNMVDRPSINQIKEHPWL